MERCETKHCYRDNKGRSYCSTCRSRQWRKANPLRAAYLSLKSRARFRGIPFKLTMEEWKRWCAENKYMELRGREASSMTVDRDYDFDSYGRKAPYAYWNMVMRTKSENSGKKSKWMKNEKKEGDAF